LTRESKISILEQIDPHGVWSDEDSDAEGYDPMTDDELDENISSKFDDFTPEDLAKKRYGYIVQKGAVSNEGNVTRVQFSAREREKRITDNENFNKWFSGSKVVNENGEPLTVYHGTNNNVTQFDVNKAGSYTGNEGLYGKGIYLTKNKTYAGVYGDNVIPAYVNIKNPYILNKNTDINEVAKYAETKPVNDSYDYAQNFADTISENPVKFTENLKKAGYDGVILNKGTEIVAFEPTQIKSATDNQGTFDTNNPDIRYSARQRQKKSVSGEKLFDESILETTDSWSDKLKPLLKFQTMMRNWVDVAGEKVGRKLYETFEEPIHTAEAERIRFLNKVRDEVKNFNVKWGSKEAAAMQKYGEGQWVEVDKDGKGTIHPYTLNDLQKEFPKSWEKIKSGAEYMKQKYEELFTEANKILEKLGYDPIPHRDNYFPHMADYDFIEKTFGIQNYKLPTDLNGRTAIFKPGKPWFRNFLQRIGFKTEYDAIRGFDEYAEGISRVIYQSENIKRLRQFEQAIRDKYGSNADYNQPFGGEGDRHTHLSNFVSELQDYTNILAGKKSELDRSAEALLDRWIYRGFDLVRRQTAANQVGMNVASAMTNFIPLTQLTATTRKDFVLRGLIATMGAAFNDDGFNDMSDFITRRQGSDRLVENWWQKTGRIANVMFQVVDNFTSNVVVRSKYYENMSKGMSEEEAIKNADEYAMKLIADRSAGATPTAFSSKLLAMTGITQFQLEVNNQMSFFLKDIPQMKKKKFLPILWSYFQILVYGWLFNNVYEKIVGRRPAFDPFNVVHKAYADWNYTDKDKGKVIGEFAKNFSDQLPFSSFLTGGRIPMGSGIPSIMSALNGDTTWGEELQKPLWYLLPVTGGGQLKKAYEGNKTINEGGAYTDGSKAKLKYPVEDSAWNRFTGTLFGKSALPETQDYYNNSRSPLSEAQTKEYNKQVKKGKLPESVYKNIYDDKEVSSAAYKVTNAVSDAVENKKLTESKATYIRQQIRTIQQSKLSKDTKIQKIKDLYKKYFGE
jgi:hypothetical protein